MAFATRISRIFAITIVMSSMGKALGLTASLSTATSTSQLVTGVETTTQQASSGQVTSLPASSALDGDITGTSIPFGMTTMFAFQVADVCVKNCWSSELPLAYEKWSCSEVSACLCTGSVSRDLMTSVAACEYTSCGLQTMSVSAAVAITYGNLLFPSWCGESLFGNQVVSTLTATSTSMFATSPSSMITQVASSFASSLGGSAIAVPQPTSGSASNTTILYESRGGGGGMNKTSKIALAVGIVVSLPVTAAAVTYLCIVHRSRSRKGTTHRSMVDRWLASIE
jgi:hypothetical protein